ncbi:MAG TPA: KH domain-containing protein [Candidatus Saccharimonadales bacterium]|nr:KH domain-containing protein [Candidatus Saccharimonadales bacterium]
MSEIDQQFIEFVVKSLVGKPDAVQVKRTIDEKGVLLELTVDPEDLGRVIGKRGATAQSLRTLLRALGTKNDARYNLKIVDNGTGGAAGSSDNQSATNQLPPEEAKAVDNDDASDVADSGAESSPAGEEEVAEDAAEVVEAEEADDGASDRLRKTREELADLDDLDV